MLKYSYSISLPAMLVFCKMNVSIVKSSKYDCWFSESLGRWSVGRWFVDLIRPRKNMFGVVISLVHFARSLFCFYIDDKEKQIWLPEAVTRIFNYFRRYVSIITSNITKLQPTETSSNIYFIYKRLLQTSRKSICLFKEFFLVNTFIGVFWGILK